MGFVAGANQTPAQLNACGEKLGDNAQIVRRDGSEAGTQGQLIQQLGSREAFQAAIESGELRYGSWQDQRANIADFLECLHSGS